MDHNEGPEEGLVSREGRLEAVQSEVAWVVGSEELEVEQQGEQHNAEVLHLVFLLPVAEVVVVSDPQPVAHIHQEVAYKERYPADEGPGKYPPRVDVSRDH